MKHFLSIADVDRDEIPEIFRMAAEYKRDRRNSTARPLKGKTWGLIFSKPSTRTRVSFEVGIHELGGEAIYLNANDIQLGRGELIKDTARVLGRLVDGAVIRTFAQSDIEEFAEFCAGMIQRYCHLPAARSFGPAHAEPGKGLVTCAP